MSATKYTREDSARFNLFRKILFCPHLYRKQNIGMLCKTRKVRIGIFLHVLCSSLRKLRFVSSQPARKFSFRCLGNPAKRLINEINLATCRIFDGYRERCVIAQIYRFSISGISAACKITGVLRHIS